MKVITVLGIQGSGKTSLIRELVSHFSALGKQSAIIVNEEGEQPFDDEFAGSHKVEIDRLRGG